MVVSLNSNVGSLQAIRQLGASNAALSRTFERLSSGQRINRASDDAAGLAIGSTLRVDARVFSQGIRNFNDGLSLLNIAQGALTELSGITVRQKELAEQAANGVYSTRQRQALEIEAEALSNEFQRILNTTEFNDQRILSKGTVAFRLQGGYGNSANLEVRTVSGSDLKVDNGVFGQLFTVTATGLGIETGDFNDDGNLDYVAASGGTQPRVALGNGDGTFRMRLIDGGNNPVSVSVADFNNDGNADFVTVDFSGDTGSIHLGNGDGSFKARISVATGGGPWDVTTADMNGDGKIDIINSHIGGGLVDIFYGNGDGYFSIQSQQGAPLSQAVVVGDFNEDGRPDFATGNVANGIVVRLNQGNGTYAFGTTFTDGSGGTISDVYTADLNADGHLDIITAENSINAVGVFYGVGNGTFQTRMGLGAGTGVTGPRAVNASDVTDDGVMDIILVSDNALSIIAGNGNGTFKAAISYSTGGFGGSNTRIGDFNNDGVKDIIASNGLGIFGTGATIQRDRLAPIEIDFHSQASARRTLDKLNTQLDLITQSLGTIGSGQSRLDVAISNLYSAHENFKAAEGRIMDADIAMESSNLTRTQILQRTGAAVLAQANQQPNLALQLLSA